LSQGKMAILAPAFKPITNLDQDDQLCPAL
jgi:hypothetical protein